MANAIEKADLIIHPVRLRMLQFLSETPLTTEQLAQKMPDVAKSSIYRHLKKLLEAGMVEASERRTTKGFVEKVYRNLAQPQFTPEDAEQMTKKDHLYYFSAYVATLIQGFKTYLETQDVLDLVSDRVGYREVHFYAKQHDFDQVIEPLNAQLIELMKNPPGDGRRLWKLAVISHPVDEECQDDRTV